MIERRIPVARVDELREGQTISFRFGPSAGIALVRNGKCSAYVNRCTHMGGPVALHGDRLRCRWHLAEFDACSGEAICGEAPSGTRLQPIPLIEEAGQLFAVWSPPPDLFS